MSDYNVQLLKRMFGAKVRAMLAAEKRAPKPAPPVDPTPPIAPTRGMHLVWSRPKDI